MKAGVFFAPFDELAEPEVAVELTVRAEAAGWDGVFLWDHVTYRDPTTAVADPWVIMGAQAQATSRVKLGPMVTPPARRRPWKLAREATTVDRLSAGRLILGLGLGGDSSRELSGFGEETDDRRRAALMEEAVEVLLACWSGSPVDHVGDHFSVHAKPFLPTPRQQPRPPLWFASRWPARRPMRRAARYEGWFPIELPGPEALAEGVAEIASIRGADAGPFDVAVMTPLGADIAAWRDAGATWWLTPLGQTPTRREVEEVIDAGPPRP